MYAIIEIGGKQFKVQPNTRLYVPRQNADVDSTLTFDRVLLVGGSEADIQVGTPALSGASVTARVLGHVKSDKVIVFKKKRRKRYRVTRGHRQGYTQVEIGDISMN